MRSVRQYEVMTSEDALQFLALHPSAPAIRKSGMPFVLVAVHWRRYDAGFGDRDDDGTMIATKPWWVGRSFRITDVVCWGSSHASLKAHADRRNAELKTAYEAVKDLFQK